MKTKFITGNFVLDIDGEPSAEVREELIEQGIRYAVQRDVASKAYVAIAGEKNSKGNLQLPKGFERDSLEYSEENAAKFQKAFADAMADKGSFTVAVSQHVPGEGAESAMVRATAFVDALLDNGDKEAQLRGTLAVLGMSAAADADRDALIAFAHEQRLGITAPRKAKENGSK